MKFEFKTEVHGDHARSFHSNVEMGKSVIDNYNRLNANFAEIRKTHGAAVAAMVRELLSITGMGEIFIHPYEVSVSMDWYRGFRTWNRRIDQIVERAFRQVYDESQYTQKVTESSRINSTLKEFNTNFEISQKSLARFCRPLGMSSSNDLSEVGYPGKLFIQNLFRIDGVVEVFISPYQLSVYIGEAFDWNTVDASGKSILEQVEAKFRQWFGHEISFTEK